MFDKDREARPQAGVKGETWQAEGGEVPRRSLWPPAGGAAPQDVRPGVKERGAGKRKWGPANDRSGAVAPSGGKLLA
jgi:hypothetical protein